VPVVADAVVDHLDDVRVDDARGGAGLEAEAFAPDGSRTDRVAQDLDGDAAAGVDVLGRVDLTHAAGS
jgi:hypothetical protein